MRRRGVGASAVTKKKLETARYKERGNEIAAQQLEQLSNQLETFHTNLEDFAAKHKQEIKKNPQFRHQFQQMCAAIGVDPLASGKGFWSEMLGVGDFYYELGVQAVEICIATRPQNGGIMTLKEIHQKLIKTRGRYGQDISTEDVQTAIKKLKVLGTGFALIGSKSNQLVQSVPGELNMDHTAIFDLAQQNGGHMSVSEVVKKLSWKSERCEHVIDHLTHEGMAWVDDQTPTNERWYWFPALFTAEQQFAS
ncbi:vacuolar-sorting protein SNF8-like [Clavelina lepadiformis]|uniref:Vacuolar-sorting protein SNF8 n=1 Tax=Clavelina lepadiformis TaxID=159417 RepID=A0ABP0GL90_CLALP